MYYKYKNKISRLTEYSILFRKHIEKWDIFDMNISEEAQQALEKGLSCGFEGFETFSNVSFDGSNIFPENKESPERISLCAVLESDRAREIVIGFSSKYGVKLWLNGKCLLIQCEHDIRRFYLRSKLKKGKNVFLLEFFSNIVQDIQLQIIPYNKKELSSPASPLNLLKNIDLPHIVHGNTYATEDNEIELLFLYNGLYDYLGDVNIVMRDSQHFQDQVKLSTSFNKKLTVPIPPAINTQKLRYIRFECSYPKSDGGKESQNYSVIVNVNNEILEKLKKDAAEVIDLADQLTVETLEAGLLYISEMESRGGNQNARVFWEYNAIDSIINRWKTGVYRSNSIFGTGGQVLRIFSAIDNSALRVRTNVPADYDPLNKRYPVFLNISLGDFSDYSLSTPVDKLSEQCLCFDISLRGMTCGSYIGEAAFFEIYNYIVKHYSVDRSRVYLFGFSAGGYAAWVLAQNYPHLFAGIYPVAGLPDFKRLVNLSNVAVQTLYSDDDHILNGKKDLFRKAESKIPNMERYYVSETTHRFFGRYNNHPTLMNKLLSYRKDTEPSEIRYITNRNRHIYCYWIIVHGVSAVGKSAEVTAKIVSSEEIQIKLKNTTGCSVRIPYAINKSKFSVSVNGVKFDFQNVKSAYTHFVRDEKGKWKSAPRGPIVDPRHGMGIIDVYLASMRIILPKDADEHMINSANSWSSPTLNAISPRTFVHYPIYFENDLPKGLWEHNLLCFDLSGTSSLTEKVKLLVACDEQGYTYLGERTEGEYIVLQCTENPYDPRRTVTVISTNAPQLLSKCFFTRQCIIPSYIGGIHPYLNREILIYDGKRFTGTYIRGNKLEDI